MREAISLQNVSKSFPAPNGKTFAVRDLSFRVEKGEFGSIVGPSGCGKSTTLRLICGLENVDVGTIDVFGDSAPAARASKHFGFIFQDATLLPWLTARENIRFAARMAKSQNYSVDEMLANVGLRDSGDKYPHQLSGGMRQRVAIARALIFDPPVLLMDEPFSALDEATREGLQDLLATLWTRTRKTILYVTHNTQEAVYLSQRIVVFAKAPGCVKSEIHVNLPRPRTLLQRESVDLIDQAHAVRELLE